MPIIILEGIDGSGKSTLAQRIAEKSTLKTRIEHRGPIENTVQEEYVKPLFDVELDELLIADRWHVGEMIYGPLYRGKTLVAPYLGAIESILDWFGAVRIIMSPPIEVVRQRLEERGEDYLEPEHIEFVHKAYEDFAWAHDYRLMTDVADHQIDYILAAAMKPQESQHVIAGRR